MSRLSTSASLDPRLAPWLPHWRDRAGAKLQLWCFPPAGASAAWFMPWRADLPAGVDLRSLELPGRGTRFAEAPLARLEPLIDALARDCVEAFRPPFVLLGHSMGGTVAFELARRLQENGGPAAAHLFVSGVRAPHLPDPEASQTPASEEEVLATVRRLGGTPPEVLTMGELRDALMPVWRADFSLHRSYVFRDGVALTCPITALGGVADEEAPQDTIDAWRLHTRAAFRSRILPGDHFFPRSHRQDVLAEVGRDLGHLGWYD
jgi:medium-chain acyl-[acyl-carrier-protein] hydrolase